MQSWPEYGNQLAQQRREGSNKMTFYTLTCFALAGLIVGFAVGGFTGHTPTKAKTNTNNASSNTKTTVVKTVTPTPALVDIATTGLDIQNMTSGTNYTYNEKADGTSSYTVSAQIIYGNTNTPITSTDVTCKLWLTKDITNSKNALKSNNYAYVTNIDNLAQPSSDEVTNAITITGTNSSTKAQVQPCSASGETSWTYTISANLAHGIYYVVILPDWKGKRFNWVYYAITVS